MTLVRDLNIPTEWPPLVGEVITNFADKNVSRGQSDDPYGHIIGFQNGSRYFFFQVAIQLYSRGWVDPVPDPILFRKFGSVGNRTRDLLICSHELWPLDYRGGLKVYQCKLIFILCMECI
jgi:hypothetical protein